MNNKIQIMKFGGTSMGDAECIRRAAGIVGTALDNASIVVVVSAMGGVTARLIEVANKAVVGDEKIANDVADALRKEHFAAADLLVRDEKLRNELKATLDQLITRVRTLGHGITLLRELTPRTLATLSSIGELLSARLMAAALTDSAVPAEAVDATDIIITDNQFDQAEPLMEHVRERARSKLSSILEGGVTPVVTGFIGATVDGTLTTLGRGGSDYSATTLGAAVDAAGVIIWTDVDGVLTADPRLVPKARLLREISYKEAGELAYFGAKVLHPKTLRPVATSGIPVWIRNSFAPDKEGTKISDTGRRTAEGVRAITAVANVSLITVGGGGMVGAVGIAAKMFDAVASARANVLLISQSSSENDICLIVETADCVRTVKALREAFAPHLVHHDVEYITSRDDIAIVAVVGEKMRGTPGIAGRTFSALGRQGINIIAIAQGSSEYNVSFVVEQNSMAEAVRTVHDEFELHIATHP